MKRGCVLSLILIIASVSFSALTTLPGNVNASTLYVGGVGPGNYTTIQGAIDIAGIGDTVYVFGGTYYENVVINKTLTLVGENRDTTMIDGGGIGSVVRVTANWVNISGFSVTNGGSDDDDAGIALDFVQNCRVINNNASENRKGISLRYSNRSYIIENIATSNSLYGIDLVRSNMNNVTGNRASNNNVGIFLGREAMWNNITDNNASSNNDDGIVLYYSHENNVTGNNVSSNFHTGITLCGSVLNDIMGNVFSSQDYGIHITYDSNYNTISLNHIALNYHGVSIFDSSFNRIYHNRFVYNTDQASTLWGSNRWDDGYPSGGNYWSDYTGPDQYSGPNQDLPGSDGIGDTPRPVGVDQDDRYPLVVPFETIHPRPPEILHARLSGRNLENVTITWSLSPDDGVGPMSIIGYEIHRGLTHSPDGSGYALVAALPNGTSTFVDSLAGKGDPNNYFYRVSALNVYNRMAYARNQGAKFTRPLSPGPNLVSIPLIQSDESIETVLQTVEYDKAWFYDSSSQEWKWHMTFKAYRRGLWSMNHTMGLWVNVTEDSNLTVAGIVPAQTVIHLYKGWNPVSFPSFNSLYAVYDLKMIGAVRVEGHSPSPPYHLRILGDGEALQAGYGYWVMVEADADWIIRVS